MNLLEVVNVRVTAKPLDHMAVVVTKRDRPRLEPAVHAVCTPDSELNIENVTPRGDLGPLGEHSLAVLGMQLLEPPIAKLISRGDAGVVNPTRTQVVARPVALTGPDQLR